MLRARADAFSPYLLIHYDKKLRVKRALSRFIDAMKILRSKRAFRFDRVRLEVGVRTPQISRVADSFAESTTRLLASRLHRNVGFSWLCPRAYRVVEVCDALPQRNCSRFSRLSP